jgi:hypothetical protein
MRWKTFAGFGLTVLLCAPLTKAQEDSGARETGWQPSAPAEAVEITLGGGFSQGFGSVSEHGTRLKDVASSGNTLQLGVGYRLDPHLMLGGYVEGALYRPAHGSFGDRRNFAAATGFQAQYHTMPFGRFDPWFGAGTGWRAYWMVDDAEGTSTLHGVDLARLQAGVDCHITESLMVAPTLGLTFTAFLFEKHADQSSYHEVTDTRPTTFLSIGTTGRFDIGGKTIRPGKVAANRASSRL